MSNKNTNPWAAFTPAKSSHQEVKKTPEQIEKQQRMRKRLADLEERKFLAEMGVITDAQ